MPKPISILFTIPNFITAGSGQVMLNIIERLDRNKFAPTVCVAKKGGELDKRVKSMNIPFIEAPFTVSAIPYRSFIFRLARMADFFRAYRFHLWHSFHYMDDYTEPLIAFMAGSKAWVYTKKAMGWGSRGWLVRSYLATRIVVDNSEMPRRMFNRIGLKNKVKLIHHGIPLNQYRPDIPVSLGIKKNLNIPKTEILIACVAHLLPVKGHSTLLEALKFIPNGHLVLAGKPLDPDYTQLLKKIISESGLNSRVHFLGGVADIPSLFAEVDIAILPTWGKWRMEGCPVALLEAMACGKACIATDIPGSRDIIENGKNGILVPPENADALAAAITRLMSDQDLRRRIGQAARKRIEEHFSIEKEVALHEALYSEILNL